MHSARVRPSCILVEQRPALQRSGETLHYLDSSVQGCAACSADAFSQCRKTQRERTMDTIDALSVDAERNGNLKKAKLENGFYNIIDGEKVSTSKRLMISDVIRLPALLLCRA
jgi:hypothetical protein